MTEHPIFAAFSRVVCQSTGQHVFDFLGGATRASYKRGWEKHVVPPGKSFTPNLPVKNEHYLDWIALLTAVSKAKGHFRMAELGAGWAPWLVRGALAARQMPEVDGLELLAVEADPVHFDWVREHFSDNGLDPAAFVLLQGAVSAQPGLLRFPVIADPAVDYGASLEDGCTASATREVRGFSVSELLSHFTGPFDLLHVDIQGAEYESLPPALPHLSEHVRSIMIGTHVSDAAHDQLAGQLRVAGWTERLNLGRNRTTETPWGPITTNDGFLWFENLQLLE